MAEAMEEAAPVEETPTYRVGSWSGIPHFVCLPCGAQSFHLDRMAAHQREMHDGRMVAEPAEAPTSPTLGEGVVVELMTLPPPENDVEQPSLPPETEEPPHA